MKRLFAAFVLFGVLGVLGLACLGDSQPRVTAPDATEAPEAAQPVHGDRPRPPADVAAVTAPSPRTVLAAGDSIPFKVCSRRAAWQKPGPDRMTQVFTDRRFGDGTAPYPLEYTFYLTPFYTLAPFANSANKVANAFSGFWDNSGVLERFCDEDELRKDPGFLDLQFVGYEVREIKRLGASLLILVEPGFDGWQEVVFPYPPDKNAPANAPGVTSRQIVDTSGHLLHQDLSPDTAVAWQQTVQYDPSGDLQFVVIGGILPYASAPVTIPAGQPPLRLYSSSPAETIVSGSLKAIDQTGREVARVEWQAGISIWQPLGALDLPPGTYTLRLDDALHDWHHFVLLAQDVPLPPGIE